MVRNALGMAHEYDGANRGSYVRVDYKRLDGRDECWKRVHQHEGQRLLSIMFADRLSTPSSMVAAVLLWSRTFLSLDDPSKQIIAVISIVSRTYLIQWVIETKRRFPRVNITT